MAVDGEQDAPSWDIHLASKITADLNHHIATFKSRNQHLSFGALDKFFGFVPMALLTQHADEDIKGYQSYTAKFTRGSGNAVVAYMKWYEWAWFEAAGAGKKPKKVADAEDAEGREPRTSLGQVAQERTHVRALLQMCLRHKAARRREGVHALVNHVRQQLPRTKRCNSMDEVRNNAHHSVAYALARLAMGMATEIFSNVVLHCHALFSVLEQCKGVVGPGCILSLVEEEMGLAVRLRAFETRAAALRTKAGSFDNIDEDLVGADELHDPTRGERNQKTAAALFTLVALLASRPVLSVEEGERISRLLAFCHIEHKGTRTLSACALVDVLRSLPQLVQNQGVCSSLTDAFFKFPKVDYLRPEGVQLLFTLLTVPEMKPRKGSLGPIMEEWAHADPLAPENLEKLGNALFRRDQVTANHPMIHPVWSLILDHVGQRCEAGESVKVHVTNFIQNLIVPYKRGTAESPRHKLFTWLIEKVGQLALRNTDALERAEVVEFTAKTVGLGRAKVCKPSDLAELRRLSPEDLGAKVTSLIVQYDNTKDADHSAKSARIWVLRELRACLSVEYLPGTVAPYVNEATLFFFRVGFLSTTGGDTDVKNKAVQAFADAFTTNFGGRGNKKCRPPCTLKAKDIVDLFLKNETAKKTRYSTATQHKKKFGTVRDAVLAAIRSKTRSVLFYNNDKVMSLLLLAFLTLSTDDPASEDAIGSAECIRDLCTFYLTGTIETVEVFFDVSMALFLRESSPLQVQPLTSAIRRTVGQLIVTMARYVKTVAPIDMVVAPLVEAFHTDEGEQARQLAAKKAKRDEGEESASDAEGADPNATAADVDEAEEEAEEGEEEEEEDEEEEDLGGEGSDAGSDATEVDEEGAPEDASEAGTVEDDEEAFAGVDAEGNFEEEEKPTQAYLAYLRSMLGGSADDADSPAQHEYAPTPKNKAEVDTINLMQLVSKFAQGLHTHHIMRVYQVLLGVMRAEVKGDDDAIFRTAKSIIDVLMISKNRYFGSFGVPEDALHLLADIQSYCRKLEKSLIPKESTMVAKQRAQITYRFNQLKRVAISVFHYIGFLAQKNHGNDEMQLVLMEHYISIYYDRGWSQKLMVSTIKKDLYHFRHAFAWCFLPAAVEKAKRLRDVDSASRANAFIGACQMVQSMLSRLKGLPSDLKNIATDNIRSFLTAFTVEEIFNIKHVMVWDYFTTLSIVMKYNSKVGLDLAWVEEVVNKVTDDDALQITKPTARAVSRIEKDAGMTPRIMAIKPCTSYAQLHQQHSTKWRKKKKFFHDKANEKKSNTLRAILAVRNNEPTEDERTEKKSRKQAAKQRDMSERSRLRRDQWSQLTKEEKEERKAKSKLRKQDRIADNKERKSILRRKRDDDFAVWKQRKLEA